MMVADSLHTVSLSAQKPSVVAQALRNAQFPVDFVEPVPTDIEEPYTNGSLLTGAKLALLKGGPGKRGSVRYRPVVASLSSGFHHAKWNEAAGFCTFNGLMVTAAHLFHHHLVERIAIIDVDYHYGDGTDEILAKTGLAANVFHVSFGKTFKRPDEAGAYLDRMKSLEAELVRFAPGLIIYSAGVDAHIEDPLGGLLTTEQLATRDEMMFAMAKRLAIPVVFNLAGGYQRDGDGGISKVVALHLGTFAAALRVHAVADRAATH